MQHWASHADTISLTTLLPARDHALMAQLQAADRRPRCCWPHNHRSRRRHAHAERRRPPLASHAARALGWPRRPQPGAEEHERERDHDDAERVDPRAAVAPGDQLGPAAAARVGSTPRGDQGRFSVVVDDVGRRARLKQDLGDRGVPAPARRDQRRVALIGGLIVNVDHPSSGSPPCKQLLDALHVACAGGLVELFLWRRVPGRRAPRAPPRGHGRATTSIERAAPDTCASIGARREKFPATRSCLWKSAHLVFHLPPRRPLPLTPVWIIPARVPRVCPSSKMVRRPRDEAATDGRSAPGGSAPAWLALQNSSAALCARSSAAADTRAPALASRSRSQQRVGLFRSSTVCWCVPLPPNVAVWLCVRAVQQPKLVCAPLLRRSSASSRRPSRLAAFCCLMRLRIR